MLYWSSENELKHEEKFLGPIFLLTDFSKERKTEIVSFKGCVNRDEAMNSARLFGKTSPLLNRGGSRMEELTPPD